MAFGWLKKTGSVAKDVATSDTGRAIGKVAIEALSPRTAAILSAIREAKAGESIEAKVDEILAHEKANTETLQAILEILVEATHK